MKKVNLYFSAILSFALIIGSVSDAATSIEAMQKALAATQAGDVVTAEAQYKELIAMNSNLQEYAHFYFGDLLLNLNPKRVAEAKIQFQKVLSLSPNLKLQTESQFRLAQMALDEKAYSKAKGLLAPLEKKLRHEEMYPQVLLQLSKTEKGLGGGNFCKWVRKLYSRYPERPEFASWGLKLQSNQLDGKPTGCTAPSEDQRTRIRNLQWAGLSTEAKNEIEELQKSKSIDPLDSDKLYVQYLLHEGEVTKALDILLSHYQDRKSHFGYLMTFASAAARAGEVQAAVGSYYSAYKIGGRSKLAKQALYQAAFLSYQFQDYDGAARKFQEFMKAFPTSGLSRDAKWHLAWIRYLKGDYEGAYKSFGDLKNKPSKRRKTTSVEDRVAYWMAMSLMKQNKWEEAKPLFEVLARDHLLGYYSIAAGMRLKKIESQLPKRSKKSVLDSQKLATRYNTESILAGDDQEPMVLASSAEESETEEGITVSALTGAKISKAEKEESDASEETASSELVQDNTDAEPSSAEEEKTPFTNPKLVQRFERAKDLVALGLVEWARWDLYDIERKTSNHEYLKRLMSEYEKIESFQRSSFIGQTSFGGQRSQMGFEPASRPFWEHTYPKAYSQYVQKFSKQFDIPFELVWGIMRAESQYKKDVISPVGALGLMQVMPNTGQKIAGMMGETQFQAQKLLEPETAVRIGSRYLARLMKKFENSIPLAAAGYNAGPHRVKAWLASFGDLEMDEFIEHIPFLETRNYVKRVVSNFYIYNQLYGSKKESLPSLAEPNQIKITEPVLAKETWEDM